ncbi:E3 ubiquitin-protein ligase MIB2-like [Lytechinus pictus]|uniref:E3 ubiquitin-protein ligase MIB2-like n=1 Tax=Lytechinus pictus TaxID=7653 RepID=UPI0030BA15F4
MGTPPQPGFRVIRGPDWVYKNQDGGKGHAGTILSLQAQCQPNFPKLSVLVQWDSGDKGLYRVGYDLAFDLRIIDTANKVCHPKIWCDGCNVDEIRGIRWRCTECYAIDLCTTCYMNDEHDLSHVFMRVLSSDKTSMGPKMLPRSSSPRIALRGIFPGAKVVRHPQWLKRQGSGKVLGTVVKREQTSEERVNVQIAVAFSSSPDWIDIIKIFCTLSGSGGQVYDGHLPNLGDLEAVNEGDNVLVTATPAELETLHKRRALWKPEIASTYRKKGFVNRITHTGDFTVTFHDSQETFTMNSAALRKVHRLCLGQLVRVNDDMEMVKRLQSGHGGWTSAMKQALGAVGRVIEIDGSDIRVKLTENKKLIFSSANLTPERIRVPKPKDPNFEEMFRAHDRIMMDPAMELITALTLGDIKEAERILARHPEWINHEPMPGASPLGFFAGQGDVNAVKFLIEKGALIESSDLKGHTSLFHATMANNFETVEYLLQQGADVHAIDWEGITCLSVACAKGFFQCAHFLLMHGADVNQKGENNVTPALLTIQSGSRTIVDLIMDRKDADLKAVSKDLVSVMHGAAAEDNTHAMNKILNKVPRMVDAREDTDKTPLSSAAIKGCQNAAELLIKKGRCNVNVVDGEFGINPLGVAIAHGNLHLVDVLVKHGTNLNLPNFCGNTTLQIARNVIRNTQSGQDMKEEPFMAEMKKKWGHLGIKTNPEALLAFLVSHGGDLNATNSAGISMKIQLDLEQDPILQPLLHIQAQRGKDIARQQTAANHPLRNLTKKNKDIGSDANPVSSLLKESAAARPAVKKSSSGTMGASVKLTGDSARPGTGRVPEKKVAAVSSSQQNSTGELHHLKTELQRKDKELEILRSRVQTLEHLVKKKIYFACGHDVIKSIADLIPECPNCSEPISSVVDLK